MARDVRRGTSPDRGSLAFEPVEGGSNDDWQVFEPDQPPRRRRPWLWIGVASLVVGFATAVFVSAGRGSSSAPDSAAAASTTLGSSTTAGSTTASASSNTAAAPPFRTVGLGPLVGQPVGQRLVGVTQRGNDWFLVDIDLDTGDSIQTPIPGLENPNGFEAGVLAIDGGALVHGLQQDEPEMVTDDGRQRRIDAQGGQPILPGPDNRSVWRIRLGGNTVGTFLELVKLADSGVHVSIDLDQNLQVMASDGEGGVYVTGVGQPTWRVRPTGRVETAPSIKGRVIAAATGVIVEQRCDAALNCRYVAHAPEKVDGVEFGLAGDPYPYPQGAISPDGRRLALWVVNPVASVELTVVDLTNGEQTILLASDFAKLKATLAWASPDVLIFKQGIDQLRYARLGQPGFPPNHPTPVLVNGQPIDLALFAVGPKDGGG
jgi:hypothetical protein